MGSVARIQPRDESFLAANIDIDFETGCWSWTGRKVKGYGQVYMGYGTNSNGRHGPLFEYAHRLTWKLLVGEDPPKYRSGYCMDHLCRNPACVNPDHLEVVEAEENTRRGVNRIRPIGTHCGNGHLRTPETMRIAQTKKGHLHRQCLICDKERKRKRRA